MYVCVCLESVPLDAAGGTADNLPLEYRRFWKKLGLFERA